MNKQELIGSVADATGLSKGDAVKAVASRQHSGPGIGRLGLRVVWTITRCLRLRKFRAPDLRAIYSNVLGSRRRSPEL